MLTHKCELCVTQAVFICTALSPRAERDFWLFILKILITHNYSRGWDPTLLIGLRKEVLKRELACLDLTFSPLSMLQQNTSESFTLLVSRLLYYCIIVRYYCIIVRYLYLLAFKRKKVLRQSIQCPRLKCGCTHKVCYMTRNHTL